MSIHPEYASEILAGRKRVELRRTRPARHVTHVLIYETAPIGSVTGFFEVEGIESGAPPLVWERFGSVSGLDRRAFDTYFRGSSEAVVFRVRNPRRLKVPLALADLDAAARAPQSLRYVPARWLERLGAPHST